MKKKCTKCGTTKSLDDFNFKIKSKGLKAYQCKTCQSSAFRTHYQKNKQRYIDHAKSAYKRNREIIRRLKENPCTDCNESYPYYKMDFDHKYDKKFIISQALVRHGINMVLKEIKKCDLLCSNCHRERTFGRKRN